MNREPLFLVFKLLLYVTCHSFHPRLPGEHAGWLGGLGTAARGDGEVHVSHHPEGEGERGMEGGNESGSLCSKYPAKLCARRGDHEVFLGPTPQTHKLLFVAGLDS